MKKRRSSGVLLHPTSLPGRYGIGDLGPMSFAWVEALARAKQTWWQILPLGPTGAGDSPYQSYSAFAGNPNLISPDELVKDGLIAASDLSDVNLPPDSVDYENVGRFKSGLLDRAWQAFQSGAGEQLRGDFDRFCREDADWLDDFSLFMAIKESRGGQRWDQWPTPLVRREPAAIQKARSELAESIGSQKFRQFLFFRQWNALRNHAHRCGVRLFGDAPIFVAADSADVWADQDLFLLDADRRPRFVAGVPPDYFSATGQFWGNPLYDWPAHQASGFDWWIRRIKANLRQVDLVRLDHFRGFAAAWHIPFDATTAQSGHWAPGPGAAFFEAIGKALGELPLVAEDLGLISQDVYQLRDRSGLPGMYVLQFAYGGGAESPYLPHNYVRNAVVYTGTHDNDTTLGWWQTISEKERQFLRRYEPHIDHDPVGTLIRTAWASVADIAIVPLQDLLRLGSDARMNVPGVPKGNWRWRCREDQVTSAIMHRLAEMTELYDRQPGPNERE
jgi:4-alpha-glucanotransferase